MDFKGAISNTWKNLMLLFYFKGENNFYLA